MKRGKIVALHLCEEHRAPMVPVQEVVAVSGLGLEGDRHAIKDSLRQVLVMDKETLDTLGLAPGIIKENVTLEGLDLSSIEAGHVFRIGKDVTLEATGPCTPCPRMDEIRPGLQSEIDGRRGIITRVLNGGVLKVGDGAQVELPKEEVERNAAR